MLGLDPMGAAAVGRLLAAAPGGMQVYVHPTEPTDDLGPLEARGALRAASPADLAARSAVILAMLPELGELERQLSGPSGIQAGVHSRTTLVIATTAPPEEVRHLGDRLAAQTAGLLRTVDAPLNGSPSALAAGGLPILVGSTPGTYARTSAVLALLGRPTRVGGLGSAQIASACAQFVSAAASAALAEAVVIAERSGVDLVRALPAWEDPLDRRAPVGRCVAADAAPGPRAGSTERPVERLGRPLELLDTQAARTGTPASMLATLREVLEGLDPGLADQDLATAYPLAMRSRHRHATA